MDAAHLQADRSTRGLDDRLLAARMQVIRDQVSRAVAARRAGDPNPDDRFRGLYVSDEQADALLLAASGEPESPTMDAAVVAALDELDALARTDRHGVPATRGARLRAEFGLDRTDEHLLHLALAPDIDPAYESLYGYLNDNVSLRRATVGLALELAGLSSSDGAARRRLGASGALALGGLIVTEDLDRPFLTRSIRVPDRVIAHLLGDDEPEPELSTLQIRVRAIERPDVAVLVRAFEAGARLVYLEQPLTGPGASMGLAAAHSIDRPALALDLSRAPTATPVCELARSIVREARLTDAVVVATSIESFAERDPDALRVLADGGARTVLVGSRSWEPAWSRDVPLIVDVAALDPAAAADLWGALLHGAMRPDDPDPAEVTRPFRLGPQQIEQAARAALGRSAAHGGPVTADDIRRGARAQNAAGLEQLARRVEPVVTWDQLVLPVSVVRQMRELVAQVRQRSRVYDEWGMGAGSSKGRGVKALFTGDSGTGKTVSAEAVAQELGLDLYIIDLSTVVDKYVGETEKNLDRIFGEADRINGVLLFDEADALFGKRSEVRQAQDRYANVEVAYLLQRMEEFEGLAVLTSNLRTNLDDAFARRLDAIVDFPKPDADDRLLLWRRHLRATVPQQPDLDLAFLATAFELTGGNIRNVCLAAAFLAADAGRPVAMGDLIRAVEREYQKLGRLLLPDEFGDYFPLLSASS